MFCAKCGKKNMESAIFCKECGAKVVTTVRLEAEHNNNLDENDERYKKIKNAGSSAVALGWFGGATSTILLLLNTFQSQYDSSSFVIDLVYFCIIAVIMIFEGKKLGNVNRATSNDATIILCTSIVVVAINMLNFTPGGFVGIMYILEVYYSFRARSVLKKIENSRVQQSY